MNIADTDERAFEKHIELALIGTTREEREVSGASKNIDGQDPNDNQYYWGQPKDMDNVFALDLRRLWSFLETTQADELAKFKGRNLKEALPKRLSKDIETKGVIDVIRNGLDIDNIHVTLFYPKPSAADSEESHRLYKLNQFSLTRQQTFSITRPGLELDMALFLNGIPLFTFELKNPWTHQTARKDGQKQYMSDERNPRETILKFGRCLAHFTLDKDEVFFTTHLALEKTYFMPFNCKS